MQIWTEDNKSGFIIWTWVNKLIFNSKFKVVKGYGNRDVLNRIKLDHSNEVIIVIVDKMIDNYYTEQTYKEIQSELKIHRNIFMPLYGCTERSFLTYIHLDKYVNKVNKNVSNLRLDILNHSEDFGSIDIPGMTDPLFWKFYKDNVKADKTGNKFSEHIYNALLATYTNNTYAKITKDKIGPCWLFNCCIANRKTCQMKSNHTDMEKIKDIMINSEFGYTVSDIFKALDTYLNSTYRYNEYDVKWKDLVVSNMTKLDIAYYADAYMKVNSISKWTYENVYRRMHK